MERPKAKVRASTVWEQPYTINVNVLEQPYVMKVCSRF
jgi:hypothetical protein